VNTNIVTEHGCFIHTELILYAGRMRFESGPGYIRYLLVFLRCSLVYTDNGLVPLNEPRQACNYRNSWSPLNIVKYYINCADHTAILINIRVSEELSGPIK
jgi:hypothetical protein